MDCSCWRSREKIPSFSFRHSWSSRSSRIEAIDFQTSGNIILRGYRLWNNRRLFPSNNFTIELYQGNTSIAEKTQTYNSFFPNKNTFEVYFSRNIYLKAGVNYTAAVRIPRKINYYAQNSGMNNNFCSGVNVAFKKSAMESPGLSSNVRQIPALIFLSLKC